MVEAQPAATLVEQLAGRYCGDARLAREGLPRPPRSSLGHGAAGVAYFLLRYATLRDERRALEAAGRWTALAERALGEGEGTSAEWLREIPRESLHYGEAGVWWTRALVARAAGEPELAVEALRRFVALFEVAGGGEWDATLGRASLLLGAATLVEELDSPADLLRAGDELARELETAHAQMDADLGAAHGPAGVAHALLRWSQATGSAAGAAALRLLDQLAALRLPSGLWPKRRGTRDGVWLGWCHGSSGWVQLWVLAWEVLGAEDLLALAQPPASHAVAPDADAYAHLCCGRAGQAYAGLAMYQATAETRWLSGARTLAAQAAAEASGEGLIGHSLMRGDVGIALLALEAEHPERAVMPCYRRLR